MNIKGGGEVRKPFRTTIDEEILHTLKTMALEQGVHVNDIIEHLVSEKTHADYLTQDLKRFDDMNLGDKQLYFERRLSQTIREIIWECKFSEKPANLSEIIAKTTANILLSDEMLFPKQK